MEKVAVGLLSEHEARTPDEVAKVRPKMRRKLILVRDAAKPLEVVVELSGDRIALAHERAEAAHRVSVHAGTDGHAEASEQELTVAGGSHVAVSDGR